MTTELAFQIMLCSRGIYKKLGLSRGTVGKLRHDLKHGKKISFDQKVRLLQMAGFKVFQELHWTIIDAPETSNKKDGIDYLNDFPGLTYIGRRAGMRDEVIRLANEAIVKNPSKFVKIYKMLP